MPVPPMPVPPMVVSGCFDCEAPGWRVSARSMPPATSPSSFIHARASLRSRLAAAVLSIGVIVVMAMVMLTIGSFSAEIKEKVERFVAMDMPPAPGAKPEPSHDKAKSTEQAVAAPTPPVPDPQPVREPAFNYIHLTSQEMAAADISKMPRRREDAPAEGGAEAGSGDEGGTGTGPGGQRLYRAKWYREPTHAELSGYMPRNGRGGDWGMIACRTIEHYHVEDCEELGESPPGSGMARALRQASWQFLVYPPRLGGKTLVGAWVSIRFEFRREAAASVVTGTSDQE